MPKIPDYMDFGARPSLRTTRLDSPGNAATITVEPLQRAAENFSRIWADKKEKRDRLTYTRVKSELLKEDIRIRQELEEGNEWRSYGDDYRTRITEARNRLSPQITDPNDRVIFDADAELLTERGAVDMLSKQQKRLVDFELASLQDTLMSARHDILKADAMTQRDILSNAHESIDAAVERGYQTAEDGAALKRAFVQDVAEAELLTMDPRERIFMLDRAIEANVDPNDYEQKAGTGSLADFLPQDVRIKMKRDAERLVDAEDTLIEAQDVTDRAFELFKADTAENERLRSSYVRENLTGEARAEAERMVSARNNELARYTAQRQDEVMKRAMENIRIGLGETVPGDPKTRVAYTTSNIPRDEWVLLSSGQQKLLRDYSDAMQQGRSFAFATQNTKLVDSDGKEMPSYSLWRRMSSQEKAAVDLDSPDWLMSFTEADWRMLKGQQEQASAGNAPSINDLESNSQLVRNTLIKGGWIKPKPGDRPVEEDNTYAEVILELDRRVHEEQVRRGRDGKLGYPDFDTRRNILNEIMTAKSFTGGGGFLGTAGRVVGEDWRRMSKDNLVNVYEMTDEQVAEGWLPMEGGPTGFNATETYITVGDEEMNVRAYLIAWAKQIDPQLDREGRLFWQSSEGRTRLERAWFAYYNQLSDAEIEARLTGQQ